MRFRFIKKKPYMLLIPAVVLILAVALIQVAVAGLNNVAAASNDETILASKDYVDQETGKIDLKVKELTDKVAELSKTVEELKKQLEEGAGGAKFEVLELEEGQQLITGASTEIILRGGKATAIASQNGGLSDVTAGDGRDILTGENVPLNHLLIVSRDDGRGLKVTSKKAYLLVKGTYEIK
ncbi:MAG TPA: hypothetical protein GXX14_12250 [Clostridiaceae bacterium]|nr:hypothetical protein [Clostridiaceae bacterium]